MKNLLFLILITSSLVSCKKEGEPVKETPKLYVCPTCITTPDAKPEHDGKSSGVYKGVLAGSSGYFVLFLHNTGSEVKCEVTFDGRTGELTTSDLSSWTPGDSIKKALFTGKVGGNNAELTFSVSANGQDALVDVKIPGHNVTSTVYKESSLVMITAFEGTTNGDIKSPFNFAIDGNDFTIITPGLGGLMQDRINHDRKIDFVNESGIEIRGNFYGDEAGGTWKNFTTGESGGWKALRTL